ncbi:MAG: TIGR03013 family XrtA/PEP-CTERM system glycosyltransferase [Burkholderiales bacterium]
MNTLFQVAFDLVLPCLFLVVAVAWLGRGGMDIVAVALPYALLFAFGMMAVNTLLGVYRRAPGRLMASTWARVILCFVLAAPVAYGMSSLVPGPAGWHEKLEMAVLLALAVMVAVRGYVGRGARAPLLARRVMVLGTGAEAAAVERSLTQSGPGVRIVGFYPVRPDEAVHVARDRVLSADGYSLADIARKHKVDEIVVAVHERRDNAVPLRGLLDCKLAGVRVLDLSGYFERALGQVRLESLRASWLIYGEGFRQGTVRRVAKRVFDVIAAMLLLGVFWPLMLLSAILIALESGFPVFYRQERVGQGGRLFRLVKLRSMRSDAEYDGTPRWAASHDERATRVGRALRRFRIDELPQLYNVLKGDMSLVGPRPERPYFVAQLTCEIPFYAARHSVKPGLTGWAQVRYRYGASVNDAAQKLQYDLYYAKNHTLFLDTVILFETVGVVLSGAGAH